MHAEDLCCVRGGQALNVADASLQASLWRGWGVGWARGKAWLKCDRSVAAAQQMGQQDSVVVICHSATIVNLTCHILQSCPGDSALLQQHHSVQYLPQDSCSRQ